ncbi:uncharacterized protein LOC124119946 [Haliotis rufescens]|uniref:uncharacterized protein LOC124119946 n=1 Tax=Haliotis rufescens TaxID=6454 RepID=UPI00201EEF58|nr:uncharacterized protein LOC124119946 [Haliotis rufescens]XP_046338617.2 uncharacterized protein LOC124119946 [Haliotis rufescens]
MESKTTLKRSASDLNDIDTDVNATPTKQAKVNVNNSSLEGGNNRAGSPSGVTTNGTAVTVANGGTSDGTQDDKPAIVKIASVQRDAEVIASVVPNVNVLAVYDKLASQRKNPNRMDIVTTELLDNPPDNDLGTDEAKGETASKPTLYEDVKSVVHKVKQVAASMKLNPAEIYVLLERHADAADRTDVVANWFLQDLKNTAGASNEVDLFDEVQKVITKVPAANPDQVYTLLESFSSHGDRVQKVVDQLTKVVDKPVLKKDDSLPNDPQLRNDPVFLDMRKVAKMFPEMDRNEIYAYIEAHHDKKDRVQLVIEEILRSTRGSLSTSLSVSSDGGEVTPMKPAFQGACSLQGEVDQLREIFPDCDPNYLFEQLEEKANDAERVKNLAAQMFEKRNYPKLKDTLDKQQKIARQRQIKNLKFDMENFLSKFPDPVEYFSKTDTNMSDSYKEHCLAYVKNEFEWFKDGYLKKVLNKNNFHLAPALQEFKGLKASLEEEHFVTKKLRQEPRTKRLSFPDEPDERFYHELIYSQNEQRIKDHFLKIELDRKRKLAAARRKGELYECGCCFDDELLFEDLSACADGHLVCRECIRRSTESALGEGKTKFPCLTGECEYDIPLTVLQEVLTSAMFSRMLSRLQEEEIRMAEIPDLVSCPFCNFATIMANPSDKVFKCLNSECLKETCRLCKEPNHVPLKCEEVEKQGETSMRTYIENRISEAMLRTCHRCKKRFFKDSGCNKMTCSCGATSCYVCREPDIDYDHFNGGRCSNTEDAQKIHLEEMEKAAEEAKAQYLKDHPDADIHSLKYDPRKHVQEYKMGTGYNGNDHDDGYDEYNEEGSDDGDDDDSDY